MNVEVRQLAQVEEAVAAEVRRDIARKHKNDDEALFAQPQEPRLPRRIPGGFDGVRDEIDARTREWSLAVRVLDQTKPLFVAAQRERERLEAELARILPSVQESSSALKGSLEAACGGEGQIDVAQAHERHTRNLEALSEVTGALVANLVAVRATWESYAQAATRVSKLREDLRTIR